MAEFVALERQIQASGALAGAELKESQDFCALIEKLPPEELETYDYFLAHMPRDVSDPISLVLRIHLLVEQRTLDFVQERLLNPEALTPARLESHQLICLAEALSLPNEQPKWTWQMVKRLNNIRNDLAHNLLPGDRVDQKIDAFAKDYANRYGMPRNFIGCGAHLYAQISELARLAKTPDFRVPGKTPAGP